MLTFARCRTCSLLSVLNTWKLSALDGYNFSCTCKSKCLLRIEVNVQLLSEHLCVVNLEQKSLSCDKKYHCIPAALREVDCAAIWRALCRFKFLMQQEADVIFWVIRDAWYSVQFLASFNWSAALRGVPAFACRYFHRFKFLPGYKSVYKSRNIYERLCFRHCGFFQ